MKNSIALIIATYNRPKHIEDILNNLKKIKVIENKIYNVLIVENCPQKDVINKTKEICNEFKVDFLSAPGFGRPHALNEGVKKVNSDFVAFVDDDCIIEDPMWLEKLANEFKKNPKLGYVSGKVSSLETKNKYQNLWEKKGGLSKGNMDKYWSTSFLQKKKYLVFPWPFHKICAGANFMIPKKVLNQLDGFDVILGEQGPIKHGYTLDIGYQIASKGYELLYKSDIEILHSHPNNPKDIVRKLFYYGQGDTAYPMNIFIKYKDYRYLWWALLGHPIYTINKMLKSLIGKYPLSIRQLSYGLIGNLLGWPKLIYIRLKNRLS